MRLLPRLVALAAVLTAGPALAQGELLESRESVYNNIYVHKQGDLITMQFGKNERFWTESVYDSSDPEALPVTYTRYLTAALAYPPKVDSILEIGLGGGRTASYLNIFMPDVPILSVELDPEVIEMAKKYFDVRESETLKIEAVDGRIHLMRSDATHDLIMVDAYRGPFVPFHMLTREFYITAKRRLAEGGVLAQNIEPTTMLFDSAIATLASVFDNVDLYPSGGNVVAMAYDGPPHEQADLLARAQALQEAHGFKYPLPEMIGERRVLTQPPDAEPLVDDFAPVEMLKSIARHNQGIDAISRPAAD
ncbi:MAG TPA: fused MFS/spermidine synthase [Paracoccaceae bacterium]|nr:fused MFS/spermidine synthase [Paracoccaceae bacterium]